MKRTGILIVAVVTCLAMSVSAESYAQSGRRSGARNRSISRPTLNPYSSLTRSPYGSYGSYGSRYGGIDPRLAPYLRGNQSSASRLRRRDGATNTRPSVGPLTNQVNPSVQRMQANRAARTAGTPRTGVAPTGIGGGYMQYSHFYQPQTAQRRR